MSKTWRDVIKKAKHYLATDVKEVYLDKWDYGIERPWDLVYKCEPGGSHRLDISTSVWFYAKHPCGLEFRWTFDIEPDEANGKGHYQIDADGCRNVLKLLPPEGAKAFKKYLADCAVSVKKKADEWQGYATRQYTDAKVPEELSQEQEKHAPLHADRPGNDSPGRPVRRSKARRTVA